MRAIVYLHAKMDGLGLVEPALRQSGFELEVRLREPRADDARADLLVVMGGPMSAYEVSRYPFLLGELNVLRERVAAARPVFGVCLGAQLFAAAAGARIFPGARGFELGVEPVSLTTAGDADPAFSPLPSPFDAAHWHGDTWDDVPGSSVLASTARYPQQAFRLGPSYGIQFHLELTPTALSEWVRSSPKALKRANKSAAKLAYEAEKLRKAQPLMESLLSRLGAHFAGAVA